MMGSIIALFWLTLGLILWSLAGYGLVWIALARLFGRRGVVTGEAPLHATMLIAARNEAATIRAKMQTVLAQDCGPHRVDVMVVSDGSEDSTLAEALATGDPRVRAFQTARHGGKAAALNAGLARIDADVVIFSDANSLLSVGALRHLLAPFANPAVGGVCGRLRPQTHRGGWLAGVEALFWAYDNALKAAEGALGGVVSAQGTLYALRRSLVPGEVPSAMADDFYISVQAPAQGMRLAFAPRAEAVEEVTARTRDEFMRRVRSTERGWRALWAMRRLMNPARHGLYAVQLISHKLIRRLVAFLLPLLLVLNLIVAGQGPVYLSLALAQLAFYAVAGLAIGSDRVRRLPGARQAAFFVMGHMAMGLGILRAAMGVQSQRWSPVRSVSK
ncbi:MAG: glycosyltransferase [Paracoccaceae bacterium]